MTVSAYTITNHSHKLARPLLNRSREHSRRLIGISPLVAADVITTLNKAMERLDRAKSKIRTGSLIHSKSLCWLQNHMLQKVSQSNKSREPITTQLSSQVQAPLRTQHQPPTSTKNRAPSNTQTLRTRSTKQAAATTKGNKTQRRRARAPYSNWSRLSCTKTCNRHPNTRKARLGPWWMNCSRRNPYRLCLRPFTAIRSRIKHSKCHLTTTVRGWTRKCINQWQALSLSKMDSSSTSVNNSWAVAKGTKLLLRV